MSKKKKQSGRVPVSQKEQNKPKAPRTDYHMTAYLLAAISICGRILLGVPIDMTTADATLAMAMAGAMVVLAQSEHKAWIALPAIVDAGMVLLLSGTAEHALWWVVLRALDLWVMWVCALFTLQAARKTMDDKKYDLRVKVVMAVTAVLLFAQNVYMFALEAMPESEKLASGSSVLFVVYNVALLGFVILCIRAFKRAKDLRNLAPGQQ